jgi:hypothetical protein
VDSGDEFLYKNVIDTSSDEDFDDDLLTDVQWLGQGTSRCLGSKSWPRDAIQRLLPPHKGNLHAGYRQFRMSRPLFVRLMEGVKIYDNYFVCKEDAIGKVRLSSYQKCTTTIRIIAYGVVGDLVHEYVRMRESSCLESMYNVLHSGG